MLDRDHPKSNFKIFLKVRSDIYEYPKKKESFFLTCPTIITLSGQFLGLLLLLLLLAAVAAVAVAAAGYFRYLRLPTVILEFPV